MPTVHSINELNSDIFGDANDPNICTVVVRPRNKSYGFTFYLEPINAQGVKITLDLLGYEKKSAFSTVDTATTDVRWYSDEKYQIILFDYIHSGLDRPTNIDVDDEDVEFINLLFAFKDQ